MNRRKPGLFRNRPGVSQSRCQTDRARYENPSSPMVATCDGAPSVTSAAQSPKLMHAPGCPGEFIEEVSRGSPVPERRPEATQHSPPSRHPPCITILRRA